MSTSPAKRLFHALAGDAAPALVASFEQAAREQGIPFDAEAAQLAGLLAAAYPALSAQMLRRPSDVAALRKGKLRIARDLRSYRRLVAPCLGDGGIEDLRRGLRVFAAREKLRIAARELLAHEGADVDVTARELSDLAQVCIEVAVFEALRWALDRFGATRTASGAPCAMTVLGMGKLGGRELNCGSDVDLVPFYETDDGDVVKDGVVTDVSLHEYFTRVTRRFVETLDEATDEGICWRVDLRLRPEGARGPLVNALAAAERYYETWGRTWERAALLRARPVAGDPAFGGRLLEALSPFVWRKNVDPRIAREMSELVARGRTELSKEPERDLKLGTGGIREAEFFVQSLQLVWGGREPSLRHPNTLEALRRLRARGFVTDRESRDLETGYVTLRRLEHRVQFATGLQTHALPRGPLLETIARTVGHPTGHDLERELDKIRRRVAARFASLTQTAGVGEDVEIRLASLLTAIDEGDEAAIVTALSDGASGIDFSACATPDFARHLLALARRPDFPLGPSTRDRHPELVETLLASLSEAADPEQAARLLAAFFARLATPSLYARALAEDRQLLRKLVGLFGASAFLGESLVYHPSLMESVLFAKGAQDPEQARREVDRSVAEAMAEDPGRADVDEEDRFVASLRRAKMRVTMEVGLAELSGELSPRDATRILSAVADATLEHATRRALAEKGLDGGLSVIAMGKLGGSEINYGSDLDVFFVFDASRVGDEERYMRAAQRVLRLVSTPHGEGPGYELDTRLRPSGSHGLLVVSLEAFARYHGLAEDGTKLPDDELARERKPEGEDWERQALIKARPCAGDPVLGQRFSALSAEIAYGRGAPDPARVHHLRMRMERELGRERRPSPGESIHETPRYDVKLGHGGIVDVEFAVQWLQMKHGDDPRVRVADTQSALSVLESCGYLDANTATILREGYLMLRRLEQSLRVVHGTSASFIEEGAPGMAALARRMGFRGDRHLHKSAVDVLLDRYRWVTRDVRTAYLSVLGLLPPFPSESPREPVA